MRHPEEQTCWESRRHAVVLARPLARGLTLGLGGFVCFVVGWPVMLVAPPLIALGALGAGLSVWRWERTRVVLTTEKLFVVHGTLRRRAAAIRLDRVATIEVEQSLLGRDARLRDALRRRARDSVRAAAARRGLARRAAVGVAQGPAIVRP